LLHVVTAGTCTVTAAQNGLDKNGTTTNYAPATSITLSFAITGVLPDPTAIVENDADTDVRGVVFEVDWLQAVNLGGSAFRHYEIKWAPQVPGVSANDATAGSATVTDIAVIDYDIRGLLANVLYDVQVRVVTAFGVSPWSDPILALTYHSPGQPTAVSVVAAASPGAATVTWTEPVDNGGTPITGYTAEALVAGNLAATGNFCTAPSQGGVTPAVLSCTISGLNGSTSYAFRVDVVNGVGGSVSTVTPSLSLGIVQTISLGNISQAHSRATVKMPASNPALPASASSGLPLAYSVSSSTPLYGAQGSRTVCSVDAHGVITIDLVGTCTIVASQNGKDARGVPTYYSAAASQSSTITVTATAPSEVQNATAQSGDQTLTLAWTAPASDGGAPITHYRVIWYPSATPGVAANQIDVSGSSTGYTISSLKNGVTYTVMVQALNAAGLLGS
jgi:hypothetical protein